MKKLAVLLTLAVCLACTGCARGAERNPSDSEHQDGSGLENGTVEIQGEELPARAVECHMCHGDGVCFHCDGDAFRNGRRCSRCDGTGKCSACGGAGTLEVIVINGQDYTVCTTCHGGGKCGGCDGSGKMGYQSSTLGHVGGNCMLCKGSGKCVACKGTGLRKLAGF